MTIKFLAGAALVGSVAACSSSGDSGALLIESAQACGAVCADHSGIGSIAYEAGGGSPLLFGGKVSVDCECATARRGAVATTGHRGEHHRAGRASSGSTRTAADDDTKPKRSAPW